MRGNAYEIYAKVWIYPGEAGWHFLTIEKKIAKDIKTNYGHNSRGFGSLPVLVAVGKTKWKTSIFPDRSGVYFLPIKKEVRKNENIKEGDTVEISLEIRD